MLNGINSLQVLSVFTFACLFLTLSHSKATPYFDAHIHLASGYHKEIPYETDHTKKMQEVYAYELDELFNKKELMGGFLLTPTYYDGWLKASVADILDENRRAAQEIKKKYPLDKNFRILCGVNLYDPRALDIAEGCLSIPGIAGLKIRFMPLQRLPLVFEKIVFLAGRKKALMLVHFAGPDAQKGNQFSEIMVKGLPDQVQNLIQLMDQSPDAKLIIAHSGMDRFIGIKGLQQIGHHFKKHPEKNRNIFMEISFGFRQAGIHTLSDSNYLKIVEAWKQFGLDFVFFGSDTYRRSVERGGLPFLVDFLKYDSIQVSEIPAFGKTEKDKVLRDNFSRVFMTPQEEESVPAPTPRVDPLSS